VGRKRVLLPAFAIMGLGLALGLIATDIWTLMVSRVFEGVAVGAGVTTAVAALGELNPDPTDHGRIALTATVATVVGLAGGPLFAGSLAEFAPWPTKTPYLAALALTLALALAAASVPETVAKRRPFRLRSVAVSIPGDAASAFLLALFVEMTAYAVAGTFAGLGASFSRDLLGIPSHFLGGLVVALLFVGSAAAQITARSWPPARAMAVGLAILAIGLAMFVAAVGLASGPIFFACAAVLGIGHGLAYFGAQELTDRVAPPDRRAQIFSAFQLGLYFGATAPAVIVGFAAGRAGLAAATVGFAIVVGGLCILGWVWVRARQASAARA
jgi:predicted MFS family arabinose efflux permease